jgi:hypothetical protein
MPALMSHLQWERGAQAPYSSAQLAALFVFFPTLLH